MYDWKFYFDRTIGGRRLRDGLGGEAALAVMAARRAAWENQAAEAASADARPRAGDGGPDGAGHAGAPGRSEWVSDELRNQPHVTLACGHLSHPGSGPLAKAGYGYCRYHGVTRTGR